MAHAAEIAARPPGGDENASPNPAGLVIMDTGQPPIHPIIPPPAIYDYAYKGKLAVRQGTMAQVEHYCHTMHGIVSRHQALGCSKVDTHSCFVMIPRIGGRVTASIQSQIRRHELAHCNGWPANHPR
jgi:hypothetical protein